ncbi:MAG TPA: MotA/TolQ/ExbB proton channel family protein [Draconibacterium sp.]|nr:MotA/TolQ/ExbB proton channel family protein [Draconibacterium sp.]
MKQLFYEGGPLFMGILTIIFIVMIAWAVYHFLPVLLKKEIVIEKTRARLKHIRTIGSFALIFGVFGQLIGLYQAFGIIEGMGEVSPALLMGGLKVSMITTFYGILIFMISLILWIIMDYVATQKIK